MALEIKFSSLLQDIITVAMAEDRLITGITSDSRNVKPGDLFLAYQGAVTDGKRFISSAIKNGAVAVLCDDMPLYARSVENQSIPILVVPDLKKKVSQIAAKFYDYPTRKLTVIGVTGTNGKTSIVQHTATILNKLGVKCGVIGTIGAGFFGKIETTINTTPDPVILQRYFYEFYQGGVKVVAMEVSSQGLAQWRVSGVEFTIGVFTNLTRDHLDCHGSMFNYGNAKKSLFLRYNPKYAVVNFDDDFGRKLIKELKGKMPIYAYTFSESNVDADGVIRASNIKIDEYMMAADVTTPWGDGVLKSELLGRFNLSNLMAVLGVLGVMNIDVKSALNELMKLEAVTGRMQAFGGKNGKPLVVVDYAHTPDALKQALLGLRGYCRGSLWCVFGCGGDKDRGKRPLMGEMVERYSDHMVITNDNPRSEDQKNIVDDILSGLLCPWAAEVEYDRMSAIEYAINHAAPLDVILVAGKGHETCQIVGNEKLPFSDQEVVIKALGL